MAIRIATLIQRLQGRRRMPSLDDLARELDVHKRTIYRDLIALEYAGVRLPRREKEL